MKNILYFIYALMFYIYNIFSINSNKTTFIMSHDNSINGNIMRMYREVIDNQPEHICKFITKEQIKRNSILKKVYYELRFIFITPYYLATSKTIFLDNVFLPMAYMKFKKEVKVIQLWHGCNTLKKFGQLSNEGKIRQLEKKANSKYTHIIVSSKKMIKLHKEAFGVDEKKIYPLGLPRIDLFFYEKEVLNEKNKFYVEYPWLKGKKIILYAPTFRDNKIDQFDNNMNLDIVIRKLPSEYIIINKFHPFVSKHYGKIESERMIDMSDYEDLTRLLLVADLLISDYSSIIFDYALLNKPIIFYAYDQAEYENKIRGFYYNYNEYSKNRLAKNKEELIKKIYKNYSIPIYESNFISNYVDYYDFKSSKRIYSAIYNK